MMKNSKPIDGRRDSAAQMKMTIMLSQGSGCFDLSAQAPNCSNHNKRDDDGVTARLFEMLKHAFSNLTPC